MPVRVIALLALAAATAAGCTPKQRLEATGAVCTGYHVENTEPIKMTLDEALARLDAADDWKQHPPLDLPRHPAEKYLKGWVIVLDPGHGGKSLEVKGWKTGPTGVREAEMNLRVGLMLRELLEDAGAIVAMTRESEVSDIADDRIGDYDHGANADPDAPKPKNTLQLRAEFANNFLRPEGARPGGTPDADGNFRGADLFISLHHNASSKPTSNYTTVWFHGPAAEATVELDAARHLAREIGRALRTDVGLTSPVMNDQQMYATGFGVLRHARVPAVLTESSFFTNPQEEQRLADPGYLIREAYAIYTGLCELAYSGRPTQSHPEVTLDGDTLVIATTLDDGLPDWWGHDQGRTLPSSVAASVNGVPADLKLTSDPESRVLTLVARAKLPAVLSHSAVADSEGQSVKMVVRLQHANFLKAHNWPQAYEVEVGLAGIFPTGGQAVAVTGVRSLGAYRPPPD